MGVVYMLTNNINDKHYIGSTKHLDTRLSQHMYSGSNNPRTKIAKAINKHGWENFSCTTLHEHIDFTKLLELEGQEITRYNAYGHDGYNSNSAGSGTKSISFRPSDLTMTCIRMYMDAHGVNMTQAINELIQLGGSIWLEKLYTDE